ncbi:MAG: bacillithiol system redox-active protein YtxJ [Planctomycetota bacterium]
MKPPQLQAEVDLDTALASGGFLVFKHSLVCPVSARAFREYALFVEQHPNVPTGWIDVIGQRPLSKRIESATGVQHESPQALWLKDGRVAWSASHGAITGASLAKAVTS